MYPTLVSCSALLLATAALLRPAQHDAAHATLKNTEGKTVGRATLWQTPNGTLISADFSGLASGVHAFHVHTVGKCEPPFESAGGHFNPSREQHGVRNPKGMHAGDLPNLHVPASGSLKVEVLAPELRLTGGSNPALDDDGAALVVHASADDYMTDPAGDAGKRIACGEITE